jgi:hypothetical protein
MKFMDSKAAKPIKLPVHYSRISQPERARVRAEYVRLQNGNCWFCKQPLNDVPSEQVRARKLNLNLFPSGFLRHPVHLHHDHDTDLTIGAVHAECNGYLWQYLGQ